VALDLCSPIYMTMIEERVCDPFHYSAAVETSLNADEEIFLNDIWTVYFHDPFDSDWTNKSYHKIGDISTINDFWNHIIGLGKNVQNGMFFIMREHIFPCWDDPENLKGGCMSLKVLKDEIQNFWGHLAMQLVSESLLKEEHRETLWNKINGISVSPKKNFCIVKIWVADCKAGDAEKYDILKVYHGDIMFKSNQESIELDTEKILHNVAPALPQTPQ